MWIKGSAYYIELIILAIKINWLILIQLINNNNINQLIVIYLFKLIVKIFGHNFFIEVSHREIFSESCKFKPNYDCIYNFPIDLAPNGIPFGVSFFISFCVSFYFHKIAYFFHLFQCLRFQRG